MPLFEIAPMLVSEHALAWRLVDGKLSAEIIIIIMIMKQLKLASQLICRSWGTLAMDRRLHCRDATFKCMAFSFAVSIWSLFSRGGVVYCCGGVFSLCHLGVQLQTRGRGWAVPVTSWALFPGSDSVWPRWSYNLPLIYCKGRWSLMKMFIMTDYEKEIIII